MPNGRATLDCCYCEHFGGDKGYPQGAHQAATCLFHQAPLPATTWNRICVQFQPSDEYWRHNTVLWPPARRFAWMGTDLQPGTLYLFGYNSPNKVEEAIVLRTPDYNRGVLSSDDDGS